MAAFLPRLILTLCKQIQTIGCQIVKIIVDARNDHGRLGESSDKADGRASARSNTNHARTPGRLPLACGHVMLKDDEPNLSRRR